MRAPRRKRRLLFGLAAIAAVFAVGAVIQDPGESIFYVGIVNDTSRTVVLSSCGENNRCNGRTWDTSVMKPGKVWSTAQTSVGAASPWLVRSRAGQRLGCLPLLFDYNASGAVVRVSQLVRCRAAYRATPKPKK